MNRRDKPLTPRDGKVLRVAIVARISGCQNQTGLSNEDQVDHAKEEAQHLYDGEMEFIVIAMTVGKGERLDRPELASIEAALRSGRYDLLIVEDLGRLVRGAEAAWLFGIGVDHGVRCISPNDGIDTVRDTWEQDALEACAQHVGHNAHTSRRIKHKKMNRFRKFGGATALPIFGYDVPPNAETYEDWLRDDDATTHILAGLTMLEQSGNCSAVADLFNSTGVPVGPYARNEKWDGAMVRRFYANTLLKGEPRRGMRHTVKNHETGRRESKKSGEEPVIYLCPHLIHIDPVRFDAVNAMLDEKNKNLGRKYVDGKDPLLNMSRKRTRFPGQWSRCAYCGSRHVWGGNGMADNLMCSGSRRWECWNSIGFDGAMLTTRIVQFMLAELDSIGYIGDVYTDAVEQVRRQRASGATGDNWERLIADEQRLAREEENIVDALAEYGATDFLDAKYRSIKEQRQTIGLKRRQLEALRSRPLDLPENISILRSKIEASLVDGAIDSPAFGEILRQLVPAIHVYLVRALDGGHPLTRAKVRIALDGIIPDARHAPEIGKILRRDTTIDIFEPAQRIRIMDDVVRLAATGMKQRDITGAIGEKPTQPAVQNALALHKAITARGLTSPYVVLREPPEDYPKLRRHKNSKYEFKPMEGYPLQLP